MLSAQRPTASARAAPAAAASSRCSALVVRASASPPPAAKQHTKQALAAAGAAVMLASSVAAAPPSALAAASDPCLTRAQLVAPAPQELSLVAEKRYDESGPVTKLLDRLPNIFAPLKKIDQDPFGADRAQTTEVADTKRPIAIPTEQEAVAPEAFPNPSEAYSPRPPVLAAAEGDEHQGANAGQFSGLTGEGRQELIDKKSPAQASSN